MWAWSGSRDSFLHFRLRKFRHSKSSLYWCGQQTRRWSACGLHLRRPSASWLNAQVYYTLFDCNPLTPLLRFVLDLYKLFLLVQQLARFWLTRRVALLSAVAELLVGVASSTSDRAIMISFAHASLVESRLCRLIFDLLSAIELYKTWKCCLHLSAICSSPMHSSVSSTVCANLVTLLLFCLWTVLQNFL